MEYGRWTGEALPFGQGGRSLDRARFRKHGAIAWERQAQSGSKFRERVRFRDNKETEERVAAEATLFLYPASGVRFWL